MMQQLFEALWMWDNILMQYENPHHNSKGRHPQENPSHLTHFAQQLAQIGIAYSSFKEASKLLQLPSLWGICWENMKIFSKYIQAVWDSQ